MCACAGAPAADLRPTSGQLESCRQAPVVCPPPRQVIENIPWGPERCTAPERNGMVSVDTRFPAAVSTWRRRCLTLGWVSERPLKEEEPLARAVCGCSLLGSLGHFLRQSPSSLHLCCFVYILLHNKSSVSTAYMAVT